MLLFKENIPASQAVTDISIGPSFNWELDVWGKLRSQKKAAQASYNQTIYQQQFIQSAMVNAIANYYFLLQSLDAKIEILNATIKNREEGITTIKALKEAGSVTEVAVKQNEALLYNAQALLEDVKNQIAITENTLSVLIGKAPEDIKRSPLNTDIIPSKAWQTGFPTQLLANRTDINAAEQILINAFEMVNFARASFYPTIGISGSGGLNSMNFANLFNIHSLFANIAGSITQPLFNLRRLKTQKEVNIAKQEIALIDFKEKIITAYSEVANEISTLNTNANKLKLKEQEKEALFLAIDYSEELQKQGFVDYLSVLTAKNNELNAELSLIDIQLAILTAKANLYKALGGGWQ
ncbi:MAG: efflux transporter outer membrane subunit [Chitinophagales bacterium]